MVDVGEELGGILLLSGAQSYEWLFASAVLKQPLLLFPETPPQYWSEILNGVESWLLLWATVCVHFLGHCRLMFKITRRFHEDCLYFQRKLSECFVFTRNVNKHYCTCSPKYCMMLCNSSSIACANSTHIIMKENMSITNENQDPKWFLKSIITV